MAAPTREIITVQVGNLANTACVAWWNSLITERQQCSLLSTNEDAPVSDENYGVLLKELERTSSPRAVMIDFKSNIGYRPIEDSGDQRRSISAEGVKDGMQAPNWSGQSTVHQSERDYIGSGWARHLSHDHRLESLVELEGFPEDVADSYERGRALWSSGQVHDQVEDSIRVLAEECDSLNGFNVVADATTGLLGLVEPIDAMIRDDFGPRKFIANVHLNEPRPADRSPLSLASLRLTTALSMASISEYTSAILPFEPANVSLGVLAAFGFLDTLTSPYRWRSRNFGNPTFEETLTFLRQRGCPVVGASALFPGKLSELSTLEALLASPGDLPGIFGRTKDEGETTFCASAVSLGLGSLPVQDGGAWLRGVTGSKFDCRMEMLDKALSIPSQLMAAVAQTRAVPLWDVGRGSKKTSCIATLFQSTAVGSYLSSAAEFCAKVKNNVNFLTPLCSDVPQMTEDLIEVAEVLASHARFYEI